MCHAPHARGVVGEGVPQDFVSAHMWLNILGASGSEEVRKLRDEIEKRMSSKQVEEAQRWAREWKPSKP